MMPTNVFAEQIVIDTLRNTGRCFLDDLIMSLPHLSWTEVFAAVDRMSRDGRVSLRQVSYSKYEVILSPFFTPNFQIPSVADIDHGGIPDRAA